MMTFRATVVLAGVVVLPGFASAQESFFVPAATLPSPGKVVVREGVNYRSFGRDRSGLGRRGYAVTADTSLQIGLAPELSITADFPFTYQDYRLDPKPGAPDHHGNSVAGAEPQRMSSSGLDDFPVLAKWRFYRHDFGPLDTLRIAALVGAQFPGGSDDSSDSVDPIMGLAMTTVIGRTGFNLAATYQLSTGGTDYPMFVGDGIADTVQFSGSYLYRLFPSQFSETQSTGIYAVLESLNSYETNGDTEALLAPGLMLEAPGFAIEASVQFPVYQQIEHRPQTDFAVSLGARFTW